MVRGAPRSRKIRDAEDMHHFVELELTEHIGELGSEAAHWPQPQRADRDRPAPLCARAVANAQQLLRDWALALIQQAEAAGDAVMPAYTHLQRAEPVLVAHWLLAYVSMVERDISRLGDLTARLNYCPLGSGAIAGATLALDRTIASRELGFIAPTANSMDATSDRDFLLEFLQALSIIALHTSRFAEEITLFATAEFGFVALPESFSTGSSAMPQKMNPDLTELVRGRTGRIIAAAQAVDHAAQRTAAGVQQRPAGYAAVIVRGGRRSAANAGAACILRSAVEVSFGTHGNSGTIWLSQCHGRCDLSVTSWSSLPPCAPHHRRGGTAGDR